MENITHLQDVMVMQNENDEKTEQKIWRKEIKSLCTCTRTS